MKGGKFLSSGASGCTFDKKLLCNKMDKSLDINQTELLELPNSLERLNNNIVTKVSHILYERKDKFELSEIDISQIISTVPNYEQYFRIPIAWCFSNIEDLENSESIFELKKCEIFNEVLKNIKHE